MKKISIVAIAFLVTATSVFAVEKKDTYVQGGNIVDDGYLKYCLRQQIDINEAVTKIAGKDTLITTQAVEAQRLHENVNRLAASQGTSAALQSQYKHFLTKREKQRNTVLGLIEDRHRIFKRTTRLRSEFTEFCHGLGFNYQDIKRVCNDPEVSSAYTCQLVF